MLRARRQLQRNLRRPSRQTRKGEGSSSNRTPQKKQVVARATENTNTDSEKVTSPEKSTEGDASKGKKSRKTLGTHVSKRVLRSKKTK